MHTEAISIVHYILYNNTNMYYRVCVVMYGTSSMYFVNRAAI